MTKSEHRRYGAGPGRRPPLGQVFLTDRRAQSRILHALQLQLDDIVVEIGPGPGNMTELLATSARTLVAVELDSRLAEALRERFAHMANVHVVESDVLQVGIDDLARAAGAEHVVVYGNIPYYITSPILMHLFGYATYIREMVLMVQQEVAERIVAPAGSPEYGLLSLTCQYYTDPKLLFTISPKSFSPVPKVTSAIVRMKVNVKTKALGITDEPRFFKALRAAFAQRRKTLINNWKNMFAQSQIVYALERIGADARVRAEALSLAQFAELFKLLHDANAESTM